MTSLENMEPLEPLVGCGGPDAQDPTDNVNKRIIWLDLEMSGLDVNKERIIEIAVAVTNADLTKIAEGPNIIIHQEDSLLDAMDPWCVKTHGESGLTAAVKESKVSEAEAEKSVLDFVKLYTTKGKCVLGGNSIYMDKMFLMKYMPDFSDHLHYRLVDVSTLKELIKGWMPEVVKNAPKKGNTHRSRDDIRESIKELKYYKSAAFIPH
ncbi:oligoribonuclease-like [Watersipora subatra]|uniref:oligoribonuclease-like n=1 Tax=Watersipora subatra TaxID=2589382 RepID=UPI00355C4DCC